MKKKLLLVVLALAILTSLTAGTLAVYTKSVTQSEKIEAKRFTFTASGSFAEGYKAFKLAPLETVHYTFAVANIDGSNDTVAEVPLEYKVSLEYGDALAAMPGLVVQVLDGSTVVGQDTEKSGSITFNASSDANEVFNKDYDVSVYWANDATQTDPDTAKQSFAKGLTIKVVATQKTSSD